MIDDMRTEAVYGEYLRRMRIARGVAARAWCTPKTSKTEMDSDLAEAFAEILVGEMYSPHLGCATTGELLDELRARVDVDYKTVPDDGEIPK